MVKSVDQGTTNLYVNWKIPSNITSVPNSKVLKYGIFNLGSFLLMDSIGIVFVLYFVPHPLWLPFHFFYFFFLLCLLISNIVMV